MTATVFRQSYMTQPLFVYTDQLLCQCVFICSNGLSCLVYCMRWLSWCFCLLAESYEKINHYPIYFGKQAFVLLFRQALQFWRVVNSLKNHQRSNLILKRSCSTRFFARSAAVRRDIHKVWCFCSWELRCRSVECVLLHCFNTQLHMFAVVNCADVALSVFYSPELRVAVFLQSWTALS